MTGKPAGMGEKTQAAYTAPQYVPFERVKLGEAGRLVIPAALRQQMGIKPGDELLLRVEPDGELKVIGRTQALRRFQAYAQQFKKPGESVVDEFIAEKRAMWGEE